MRLERYEVYKDSGIEWIGEIPEGWKVERLKSFTKFVNRGTTPVYVENSDVFVINQATFSKGFFDLKSIKYTDEILETFYSNKGQVIKNDLLIASTGGGVLGKVAYFDLKNGYFIADSHVTIIRTNKKAINKFYYYFFQINYNLINGILAQGSTNQTELQRNWLRNFLLPLPPLHEQAKIANFLDQKTAQINKAISLKEKLIEKLKEYRQILINDAVTKGLDKNVKMKDSGVEWIEEIPKEWEVKKFRYLFNFSKGLNITKENLQEEGIPCVNYGEIHSKYGFEVDPLKHLLKCVNEDYLEISQKSLLHRGDFIFADTSEDIEGSGNFTYLNSDIITFAGYHTIIAKAKKSFDYRYIAYFFDSNAFRNQIRNRVKGVKVYSITNAILKEMLVCLPFNDEQKGIVKYLDKQTKKIDKAINQQQKQIEKLKEYKVSLIDSVVTGKVRVL